MGRISETDVTQKMLHALNHLVETDKQNPRKRFEITDDNRKLLTDIKLYLMRKPGELDFNKGILFCGPVGTGKTLMVDCLKFCIMQLWNKVVTVMTAPYIKSNYYEKDTDHVSIPYQCFNYRFLAINDIGMERDYASGENIIQNILFDRYEKRFFTFGTTNLTKAEFFERYSDDKDRMKDRYKTMFNYVELTGESKR